MDTTSRGKPEQIERKQEGCWLAADRGSLEPRRAEGATPCTRLNPQASILGVCAIESPDFGEAQQLVEILEAVQLALQ